MGHEHMRQTFVEEPIQNNKNKNYYKKFKTLEYKNLVINP